MSTDFSQKERAFVAELAADTGRDLDGWMRAIDDSGRASRNEIIDWLRQSGFTFAKASWLERIHHNGGALIYADAPRDSGDAAKRKAKPVRPQVVAVPKAGASDDRQIDALLAAAKAYRPLASLLLREILGVVPGADASVQGMLIVFAHGAPFAALAPSPKEVRLYLACGAHIMSEPWQRVKPQAGLDQLSVLTHMLVVDDARQVTRELKELIASRGRLAG